MSKEKPEGEVVNFHCKLTLDLTAALKKRLAGTGITQEEVDEIEANGEMTEQQELDLEDPLQWKDD